MGRLGAEHVASNYNFETFLESWDKTLTEVHETFGAWETRAGYMPYEFLEIA